jgi:hypothetical protein
MSNLSKTLSALVLIALAGASFTGSAAAKTPKKYKKVSVGSKSKLCQSQRKKSRKTSKTNGNFQGRSACQFYDEVDVEGGQQG